MAKTIKDLGSKTTRMGTYDAFKVIDDTISGKITNLVTKLPFVDHQAAWAQTSANFVSKATGIVNAYVYAPAYRGAESIFWSVEMPALMNNPNVTGVVIHIFGD